MSTKKLVNLSLFLGLGIVLYILEFLYLPPLPIPGAKLGLANIVTLIILAFYGGKEAFFNVITRVVVGGLITGTFLAPPFLFSLAGSLSSFLIMFFVFRLFYGKFSFVGVSLFGATAHNLTQLFLARFFMAHLAVFFQAPLLILIAILTGVFNGTVVNLLAQRFKDLPVIQDLRALPRF